MADIETCFKALIDASVKAQLAVEHCAGRDAMIVAAFGDPALREALPVLVLGLSESTLASACLFGPPLFDHRGLTAHPGLVPRGGRG